MQIGSTNTATINLGVSGDTINVPAGVTIANAGTATGFGGNNAPSFNAYMSAVQAISNTTRTILAFDNDSGTTGGKKAYDTDNAFASNKFTVPSGAAGKYCFIGTITWVSLTDQDEGQVRIHKNGSFVQGTGYFQGQNGTVTYQVTTILDLSASDYIELHGYQVSGGAINADGGEAYTNLKGFRIGA